MFHVTEAWHANNLCGVVGLLQRREASIARDRTTGAGAARPPKVPLAPPRPSAARQKRSRPPQTLFFVALCRQGHVSIHLITSSLRTSTAALPSLLPAWGFRAAASAQPTDPKSDRLLAGAGRKNQPLPPPPPPLWGGRVPSLASLVPTGVG